MTLLTLCQDAAVSIGLPRPARIVNAADIAAQRLLVAAQDEGQFLLRRGEWSELVSEATFGTVAGQVAYSLTAIAPGYRKMVGGTIYNRTRREGVAGPMSPQDWQAAQSSPVPSGFNRRFRIVGTTLKFDPAPTTVETAAFEYQDRRWIVAADGVTYRERFAADTDAPRLDEHLVMLGVRWRMKRMLGQDYGEEYTEYSTALGERLGSDGGAPVLSLSGVASDVDPVEAGRVGVNWDSLTPSIDQL